MANEFKRANRDIAEGAGRWRLAWMLAYEDLKDRYRRSYIGVAWLTLSFLGFVGVKIAVFSGLFASDSYDYISHLTIGFALWTFINALILGAVDLYIRNRGWILSSPMAYSVYAMAMVLNAFLQFAFVAVAAAILMVLTTDINLAGLLYFIPAMVIYFLTGLFLAFLVAPIGARFRDLVHAIQTIMRIAFFATPVLWVATPGTERAYWAAWNPFTYYIEIVREPFLTGSASVMPWLVTSTMTAVIMVLGYIIFAKTKPKVPMWL